MEPVTRTLVLALGFMLVGGLERATAQPIGSFTWQLQPFCNRVTVQVVQNGAVFTLDGYDDQCAAARRAPLAGIATPNPDGTIGFGLTIVTVPGGRPVHVDARIPFPTLNGPWSDSAGNSGALVFNGQAAGSPRPAPPAGGVTTNSVTSTTIVDGSVGAADVNNTQVQLRLSGACPTGQYMTGASATGVPTCVPGLGVSNTALGLFALQSVIGASGNNTAIGNAAMRDTSTANNNTAVGQGAMLQNTTGQQNVGVGAGALLSNRTGANNTAVGMSALYLGTGGAQNTGVGTSALSNVTGDNNTAIGYQAGSAVTIGGNNIHIQNVGLAGDSQRIRIGTAGTHATAFIAGIRGVAIGTATSAVLVGTDGQLGTVMSSRRFKEDIQDMDAASAPLLRLRPVTFRYKQAAADGSKPLDYGLIAEEVAEVFPDLAVRDAAGQIETVAYHKLPALLLNELQKLHRVVEAQSRELAALRAVVTAVPSK